MTNLITNQEWVEAAAAIDACRIQLRECERAFGWTHSPDTGYEEDERYTESRASLGYYLNLAHLRMLILLERANLPVFLADYKAAFAGFTGALDKVGHSAHDPEDLYSDPLIQIAQTFDALSSMVRRKADDDDVRDLALLERILRQTPYLLADRKIHPTSEKDIRQPLFDSLKTVFPATRREIPISHVFKIYRADLGIPPLKSLVEVKYALDEAELRTELDGVYADISGYSGDPQWTRFFAVFYTATPVAAPERMLEEFKLSRVDVTWTPIIVHGSGSRPLREPKRATPDVKDKAVRGKRT